jgi:hypothetical protein
MHFGTWDLNIAQWMRLKYALSCCQGTRTEAEKKSHTFTQVVLSSFGLRMYARFEKGTENRKPRKKKKKQGRQNEGGLEFEERKAEMITSEPRPTAAEYCMKSILRGIMVIKRIANRTVPTINQSNHWQWVARECHGLKTQTCERAVHCIVSFRRHIFSHRCGGINTYFEHRVTRISRFETPYRSWLGSKEETEFYGQWRE